mmetsp:Transcript_11223/g.24531  ORF Transcript_11223/g.24531 Transcript_11223/m.24531 type:complete len:266 (-) Transcript_11223:233-1030(-)
MRAAHIARVHRNLELIGPFNLGAILKQLRMQHTPRCRAQLVRPPREEPGKVEPRKVQDAWVDRRREYNGGQITSPAWPALARPSPAAVISGDRGYAWFVVARHDYVYVWQVWVAAERLQDRHHSSWSIVPIEEDGCVVGEVKSTLVDLHPLTVHGTCVARLDTSEKLLLCYGWPRLHPFRRNHAPVPFCMCLEQHLGHSARDRRLRCRCALRARGAGCDMFQLIRGDRAPLRVHALRCRCLVVHSLLSQPFHLILCHFEQMEFLL